MTTYSTKVEPSARNDCTGCGKGLPAGEQTCEEHATSCELECLERPLFTCGMVLSDSDLTALVDWTRARLALGRFHDGWGVVCGLDVRCAVQRPGWVVVYPGYAVGCCGEDIVVCEPMYVDLTGFCTVERPCPGPAKTEQEPNPCGDVVVDLMLVPYDVPAVTELVDRCGCGGGCSSQQVVPTRIREGARVEVCRVTLLDADPASAAAAQAQDKYSRCHDVVDRYVTENPREPTIDDVIAWLIKQDIDPPCDWWNATREALKAAGKGHLDEALAAALFELVLDCRQRLLRRYCAPCSAEDLVRLARVWLRQPDPGRKEQTCVVVRVDAYPPYRRELGPFTRPVPAGARDLGPFVWQRWEQVRCQWRTLSGNSSVDEIELPTSTKDLLDLLVATDRLTWNCHENPPVPVVVTTECLGDRVVGFRSAATVQDGKPAKAEDTNAAAAQPK